MKLIQTLLQHPKCELEIQLSECSDLYNSLLRQIKQNIISESESNVSELGNLLHSAEMKFIAARKGLGISNRLKNPEDRKKHKSRIMSILNKLRIQLADIESIVRP